MVICVKNFRFLTVIIISLIVFSARPTKCQVSVTDPNFTEEVIEVITDENNQKTPGDQEYFFETDLSPRTNVSPEGTEIIYSGDGQEVEEDTSENSPTYENESYEEFYDDNEEDECKERTYGRFLLIGSGVLLVLGLCGIVCFTKKKDERRSESCPSVTTCFRSCKIEDEPTDETCIVNFLKASAPDISDSESDYQNIPLPLIYEDMGKICNNAEMFIQRCMTSSVKRTYSEPVKTLTSSKTKFRDYVKELAYLKEKQNHECTKHGAVKAFFKEMFKVFKRSEFGNRRKRYSPDIATPAKETRVKIEDSTKGVTATKKAVKTNKPTKKKGRESSSSISITSLLLKPQYQCKYYKKGDTYDTFKSRKRNKEKDKRGRGGNKSDGENLPLIINQKKQYHNVEGRKLELSKELQNKIRAQDTEELIKMCVNTMRQPFNKKFVTLFDQQNMEQFNGLQDVAATMARKMGVEEHRDRFGGDPGRGPRDAYLERNYCLPSSSKEVTPLKPKPSKEAVETFDLLVKQLYLMTANNRNLPNSENGGAFIVTRDSDVYGDDRAVSTNFTGEYTNTTEEESRSRMLRKYQELQMEVERLNRSLRQFADDFLYTDNSRYSKNTRTLSKKAHHTHKGSKKR